jgi:chemotaxis regulatin CheY-phosphate phosphatase CheZ
MSKRNERQQAVPEVVMPSNVREMGITDERSRRRYTVRRTEKSGGLVMNAADRAVDRSPWKQ